MYSLSVGRPLYRPPSLSSRCPTTNNERNLLPKRCKWRHGRDSNPRNTHPTKGATSEEYGTTAIRPCHLGRGRTPLMCTNTYFIRTRPCSRLGGGPTPVLCETLKYCGLYNVGRLSHLRRDIACMAQCHLDSTSDLDRRLGLHREAELDRPSHWS